MRIQDGRQYFKWKEKVIHHFVISSNFKIVDFTSEIFHYLLKMRHSLRNCLSSEDGKRSNNFVNEEQQGFKFSSYIVKRKKVIYRKKYLKKTKRYLWFTVTDYSKAIFRLEISIEIRHQFSYCLKKSS